MKEFLLNCKELGVWRAIIVKFMRIKFLVNLYLTSKHPLRITYILEKNWYGCSQKDREILMRYSEKKGLNWF